MMDLNGRRSSRIGLALVFIVAILVAPTATAAGGVKIVTKLATVTAGSPLTFTATLSAHVNTCSGSLHIGNTTSQKNARVAARRVTFNWTIPANARAGSAVVTISCAGLGTAKAMLTIAAKPVPASAEVTKSGFSTWGGSQYRFIDWGTVLVNNSADEDAGDVQVTVMFSMPRAGSLPQMSRPFKTFPPASPSISAAKQSRRRQTQRLHPSR